MVGDADKNVDERLFLRSVARALQVLEVFGRSPHPLSLRELAQGAGIDKSAAQRIAQTLLNLGYMEKAPNDAGLLPGKKLLDRSFDYLRTNPLIERASPVLSALREATGERVDLSLFDGTSIIYALRLQSKRETFYATLSGRRIPAYAASGGRCCMAHLSDDAVRQLLEASQRKALTSKTITDLDAILAKITEAREDGYACALEESLIGEIVIAASICTSDGQPIGAVHIAASLSEWEPEAFRRKFSPLAIEAARAISG